MTIPTPLALHWPIQFEYWNWWYVAAFGVCSAIAEQHSRFQLFHFPAISRALSRSSSRAFVRVSSSLSRAERN